jgi:hypothetical protein
MSAIGNKLRRAEGGHLLFWCPGCNTAHQIIVDGSRGWTWNEDAVAPTFTPSVLVNKGQAHPGAPVCHSFVTDGRIRFLGDSTHELAGQTVDLPDWPGGVS